MLGQELNRDQSQLAQNAKSACENDVKRRPCLVKNIRLYLMAKGHNSGLLIPLFEQWSLQSVCKFMISVDLCDLCLIIHQ